jgi:hypothetical protein
MEPRPDENLSNNRSWLWGGLLIVLGAVFLLDRVFPWISAFIWATVFAGAGLVFFAVYQRERGNWWVLIPGYVLLVVAALIVMGTLHIFGELIGAFVMFAIAAPFLYVYLQDNQQWWALIPTYIMSAIGVLIMLTTVLRGEIIGMYIMFAIAAPFIHIYLRNREQWWALIPAYVMSAIGVLIMLTTVLRGEMIAAYIMFAIAVPFLYVYLRNRENWWALIPGGIMAVIGLGLLMSGIIPYIPVLLIVVGVYLLVRELSGKRSGASLQMPKTGPEADKPAAR